MKQAASKFKVDIGWASLLHKLGVNTDDLLRHAGLPSGLFSQKNPELDTDAYYRVWNSLEFLSGDPLFPLTLGQAMTPEEFNPPLFAAYCSPNLSVAIERLAAYKPIICPMTVDVERDTEEVRVKLKVPEHVELPASFVLMELVFLVNLARSATHYTISPLAVSVRHPPKALSAYRSFFGVPISKANEDSICFRRGDSLLPFLSVNNAMFEVFESVLEKRLSELAYEATLTERVRASLSETMASGLTGIGDIAGNLAMSPRTLQRKLAQEKTTFQVVLNEVRTDMAKIYLQKTRYSNAEIAFLLGYEDPNSFIRAFHGWTGSTPEVSRQVLSAN
ncbi:Virulence-regulating protein VirS [Roseibium album]|nr:Virulence-regulating protein VirS [Roseibium album]